MYILGTQLTMPQSMYKKPIKTLWWLKFKQSLNGLVWLYDCANESFVAQPTNK